jgi:hypothetical protein
MIASRLYASPAVFIAEVCHAKNALTERVRRPTHWNRDRVGHDRERGSVLRRRTIHEVGQVHAAAAGDVPDDDGGIAGDVLGQMARGNARVEIVAAARPEPDAEGDRLAGVEIRCRRRSDNRERQSAEGDRAETR